MEGITFSKTNRIKDYKQFAFVCNEAFRGSFDYKELTVEELKQGGSHNLARGESEYVLVFRKGNANEGAEL
jgi:hypothetical protein